MSIPQGASRLDADLSAEDQRRFRRSPVGNPDSYLIEFIGYSSSPPRLVTRVLEVHLAISAGVTSKSLLASKGWPWPTCQSARPSLRITATTAFIL